MSSAQGMLCKGTWATQKVSSGCNKPRCMSVYLVFSLDCILHKCSWLNLNHIRPLQWTPSAEPPEQSVDSIPYGLLTVDREKISPGEINPWNLAISVLEWVQVPAGESIICTYNFQLVFFTWTTDLKCRTYEEGGGKFLLVPRRVFAEKTQEKRVSLSM